MTLQEAKDQIAKKHGHVMWCATTHMEERQLFDEVAELYARSKWDEACEEMRELILAKWVNCDRDANTEYRTMHDLPKPEFKP